MILLIDNYDSFVYNLARYIGELGYDRQVVRNDAITVEEILALDPLAVILSPGPSTPNEAGICLDLVAAAGLQLPILGVCLGHQVIAQAHGGRIIRASRPVHGKTSRIAHNTEGIFDRLPSPLTVARYHSLITEIPDKLPIEITAWSAEDGVHEVMALQHKTLPQYGVQFHPESVLTDQGHHLLQNFLTLAEAARAKPALKVV